MRSFVASAAMALILAGSQAQAQTSAKQYYLMTINDDATQTSWLDVGNIRDVSPGIKAAWSLIIYEGSGIKNNVRILNILTYYNCSENTQAVKAHAAYDNSLTNNIWSKTWQPIELRWEDTIPGTVGEKAQDAVCNDKVDRTQGNILYANGPSDAVGVTDSAYADVHKQAAPHH